MLLTTTCYVANCTTGRMAHAMARSGGSLEDGGVNGAAPTNHTLHSLVAGQEVFVSVARYICAT